MGIVENYVKTLSLALKLNMGVPIPIEHPIVDWLVEYSSYLLNKYQVGKDGKTAYGRLHGLETRERLCQFGEKSSGLCLSTCVAKPTSDSATAFTLGAPLGAIRIMWGSSMGLSSGPVLSFAGSQLQDGIGHSPRD